MNNIVNLQYYKLHEDVSDPYFATKQSACFDLHAYIQTNQKIKTFSMFNKEIPVHSDEQRRVIVKPGDRMLIPTGLIFDIPNDYSIRIHIRSGIALKEGLCLSNSEAVIDSDYVQETFIMIQNTSEQSVIIKNGDRIAQGELVKVIPTIFKQVFEPIQRKTDRDGGLGSTGK